MRNALPLTMLTTRALEEITPKQSTVVTVGTFDGVHVGHQSILRHVVERAKAIGGRSLVVTFDPHPREVVGRGPVEYLTTLQERLDRIREEGIEQTLVLSFTYEFSQQTAEQFYSGMLLPHIGIREVIVGHDHLFGKDRQAGFSEIERIGSASGFSAHLMPPVLIGGVAVSSSAIRSFLREGDVISAATFLGYPYSLSGIVAKGDGRGRTIGFPTANIEPAVQKKVVPGNGVYFVRVLLEGQQEPKYGMMNIGVRPTFGESALRTLEVHIFDFDAVIYGARIGVQFLRKIRGERKFSSVDELVAQLHRDREVCLAGSARN